MDKSKKFQILKLFLIASVFIVASFIPTKFRSTYIYFIFNLLIIALGAEAGLLSTFSKPNEDKRLVIPIFTERDKNNVCDRKDVTKPKVVDKSSSDKKVVLGTVKGPSIFFIGNGDNERKYDQVEREGEEVIRGQELFIKAEMFIGNFYKQLKMQKEDSWKGIHEFYHKAF